MADISDYLKNEFGVVIGDNILAHLLFADDLILISDSFKGIRMQLNGLSKFWTALNQIEIWEILVRLYIGKLKWRERETKYTALIAIFFLM